MRIELAHALGGLAAFADAERAIALAGHAVEHRTRRLDFSRHILVPVCFGVAARVQYLQRSMHVDHSMGYDHCFTSGFLAPRTGSGSERRSTGTAAAFAV